MERRWHGNANEKAWSEGGQNRRVEDRAEETGSVQVDVVGSGCRHFWGKEGLGGRGGGGGGHKDLSEQMVAALKTVDSWR